ncbi:UNVERIFIED_CONTAM: hypothetical protein FKN15_023674 [Acipenser sinensis]
MASTSSGFLRVKDIKACCYPFAKHRGVCRTKGRTLTKKHIKDHQKRNSVYGQKLCYPCMKLLAHIPPDQDQTSSSTQSESKESSSRESSPHAIQSFEAEKEHVISQIQESPLKRRKLSQKVYVEFDDLEWDKREWVKVYEDFQIFLLEHQLVWAKWKETSQPQGTKSKQIQWPALEYEQSKQAQPLQRVAHTASSGTVAPGSTQEQYFPGAPTLGKDDVIDSTPEEDVSEYTDGPSPIYTDTDAVLRRISSFQGNDAFSFHKSSADSICKHNYNNLYFNSHCRSLLLILPEVMVGCNGYEVIFAPGHVVSKPDVVVHALL